MGPMVHAAANLMHWPHHVITHNHRSDFGQRFLDNQLVNQQVVFCIISRLPLSCYLDFRFLGLANLRLSDFGHEFHHGS
jgi:hypothetical protein